MSGGEFHYGDRITQYGEYSIGKIQHTGPADPVTAFREMADAVRVLRDSVPAEDRSLLDSSLAEIGPDPRVVEPGTVRRALRTIAGVASLVGQTGVPVVEAVRGLVEAIGG